VFDDCDIADFRLSEVLPNNAESERDISNSCTDAMQLGRMIARMIDGPLDQQEGESVSNEPTAAYIMSNTSQWSDTELVRRSARLLCQCVGALLQNEGLRIPSEYFLRVVPLAKRVDSP